MLLNLYKKKGITPVIGLILLVALTTLIVFDIGSEVSELSDFTIQTSESSNGVQVQVVRNDNVEQFEVRGPDDCVETITSDGGAP